MASEIKHRFLFIDNLKGIACLLIALHHLAFYGPMSDIAHIAHPVSIEWLFDYGRLAVSIFLCIGGFLTGQTLCRPNTFVKRSITDLIAHKYLRLVIPYTAAIFLAIICYFISSRWMHDESISNPPSLGQLVSHLFFLQNLLGYESLSAGLWYVAIDFQLFTVSTLIFFIVERFSPASWSHARTRIISITLVSALTLASLLIFNLNENLDATFLFFYGAYGLGLLAAYFTWIRHGTFAYILFTITLFISAIALYMDFRTRILLASVTTLILFITTKHDWMDAPIWNNPLAKLGKMSYSVFLVHFPISLLVNALWINLYPENPQANFIGMGVSLLLSLGFARVFYKYVEQR
jgi:peptidoglycan/LPS O-acetylase OafA/YrhL